VLGRTASCGIIGRTGRLDDVPQWNLGPHPCLGNDPKLPHGGYDEDRCKLYKSINTCFAKISSKPGFCPIYYSTAQEFIKYSECRKYA
jgi:hypothetical protein